MGEIRTTLRLRFVSFAAQPSARRRRWQSPDVSHLDPECWAGWDGRGCAGSRATRDQPDEIRPIGTRSPIAQVTNLVPIAVHLQPWRAARTVQVAFTVLSIVPN